MPNVSVRQGSACAEMHAVLCLFYRLNILLRTRHLGTGLSSWGLSAAFRVKRQTLRRGARSAGMRVELAEVEAVLAAHPDVGAAAARAWPAPMDRGLRLAAYLELPPNPNPKPSPDGVQSQREPAQPLGEAWDSGAIPGMDSLPDTLREWCAQRLPPAAVPSVVAVLERLPRSAAGKLARGALPPPSWADEGLALDLGLGSGLGSGPAPEPGPQRLSAPQRVGREVSTGDVGGTGKGERSSASDGRGDVSMMTMALSAIGEARVLRVFAETMGLPRLEPAADFFAAGGDSLAAAAAAAALGIDARQVCQGLKLGLLGPGSSSIIFLVKWRWQIWA